MRLLFALAVASFCTVLWLALSLARRVRRDREARAGEGTRPDASSLAPATEFFEAGEFRTPRMLRLNQDITQPGIRRLREDEPVPQNLRQDQRRGPSDLGWHRQPPLPGIHATNSTAPGRLAGQAAVAAGSEAVISDSRLQLLPFEVPHRKDDAAQPTLASRNMPPGDISSRRKSPQPARSGSFRRVDLSHYNKDLGDLTDPYTQSARNSGVRPSAAKNG